MSIFNYFVICLLIFHGFHFGQPRLLNRIRRIVDGDLASPGEIKYIVITLHDDQYYKCGGGIIGDYHVLTVAHCFIDEHNQFRHRNIKVVAGTNDLKNKKDPRRVEVDVEKVYIPKNHKRLKRPINDIALLKLRESLNTAENDLQILSLPIKTRSLTDRMALTAGFGHDVHRLFLDSEKRLRIKEGSTGLLRKANILIFNNTECRKFYPLDDMYDSYLCGKMVKNGERKAYGLCDGDSGGPLVFNSTEIVGIASWSYGCDERRRPLIYTRVSSFLDFIENAKKDVTENMWVKVF